MTRSFGNKAMLWAGTSLTARAVLAGCFLLAAIPKIADPPSFAVAIDNYHLVPSTLIPAFALIIPIAELLIAVALVIGLYLRSAAIACAVLLMIFIIAMSQTILRGIDLSCGCFGAEVESTVSWWSVLRNLGLFVLSLIVAFRSKWTFDIPWTWIQRPPQGRRIAHE